MKSLHILNGDSTRETFINTGIAGEVIVWREVLSEGPLLHNIHGRDFWIARSQFICNTFNAKPEGYQQGVINELDPIRESVHFDEITIWCEYDLHCQVNLLGALQMLQGVDLDACQVYLICPDSFPGIEHFMGIGQLNVGQLQSLWHQKVKLTVADFALANGAWHAYITQDATVLQTWLTQHQNVANLGLLQAAMQAQLKRLNINTAGLNYVEERLLQIYTLGAKTRADIFKTFWKTESIFGMGDAEIDIYIGKLKAKKLINPEL